MVQKISIKNYRNVSVENLNLGKFNVLVGPNGTGKSNFLKALGLWADIVHCKSVEEGTTAFLHELRNRNWERMLNFDADNRSVKLEWVFSSDNTQQPYQYKLNIHVGTSAIDRKDFYISYESLGYEKPLDELHEKPYLFFECHNLTPGRGGFSIQGNEGNGRWSLPVRSNELAILQLDELRDADEGFDQGYRKLYSESMRSLHKYLSRFFCYSSSEFDIKKLKEPIDTSKDATSIYPDSNNLVNVLLKWKSESSDTYDLYCKMVAPLFGKSDIELSIDPIAGTKFARLAIGRKTKYYLEDLSDGTLHAMILAALLVDREDKMSVCTIDEPETNLHPEWQSRFCDWLLSSSSSQQYFISTHSPEILDPLTAAFMADELKVFIFSGDGMIKELHKSRIESLYNDGFNLGDLYRAKAIEIGGWS